jgi:GR25 family glycosyltransferase involved in LPS biosynthesis
MKLNIEKIFIIHYKKLTERKTFIEDQISKSGLNVSDIEWITNYDKDEWILDDIKKEYPQMFDSSGIHCKLIKSQLILSDVSMDLKHLHVMKEIVKRNIKDALIFEDDCFIGDDFIENFNRYKSQLPPDWHLFFVGGDYQTSENIVPWKNVYERKGFHSSRGTFCYSISNSGANLMLPLFKNINDPPDWYFNYVIDTLNVNNFWAEPPLIRHNYSFESTRHYENNS